MRAMSPNADPQAPRRGERWLFIAPGHYSGKCGIVDYTLWLAKEAIRSGGEVLVIATRPIPAADAADYLERFDEEERAQLRFASLEADLPRALGALTTEIERWQPTWISVQFFPPMFRHGWWILPGMRTLARALKGRKVVVMVHETWACLGGSNGMRGKLLGWLRRHEVLRGLRGWQPKFFFCSNPEHRDQLDAGKISARILPVFSNITICAKPAGVHSMADLLRRLAPDCALPGNAMTGVYFGRIAPTLSCEAMLRGLKAHGEKAGRRLFVIWIGEPGPQDSGWRKIVAEVGADACVRLGRRPAAEISWVLQYADLGLSATPAGLWPKSGGCAAMVAHGLSIVFPEGVAPVSPPPRYGWVRDGQLVLCEPPAGGSAEPASPAATWQAMTAAINSGLPTGKMA